MMNYDVGICEEMNRTMATLTEEKPTSEYIKDYTLKLSEGDRVRIEANGEYITYLRLADGELSYLGTEKIEAI